VNGRRSSPSRLACRLLAAVLPATVAGRSTIGDLLEEFHRRPPGRLRQIWFWFAASEVAVRYLPALASRWLSDVRSDLVYATRLARRHPLLVFAAAGSLTVAIGLATSVFSALNGSWLPVATADPAIVQVWRVHRSGAARGFPAFEFRELQRNARSVALEGWIAGSFPLATPGSAAEADPVQVLLVTGGYFTTFGGRAAFGRLLAPADDQPSWGTTAVVSHLFWRRHLGADRSVLGQTVTIGGAPFQVVGIVDREFEDPSGRSPSLWIPLAAWDRVPSRTNAADPRILPAGRLARSATVEQAAKELTSLILRIGSTSPGVPPATGIDVGPSVSAETRTAARHALLGLLGVLVLVLLLASINVSNLQLASVALRRPEIAIRLSLGATRWRLVRQTLTESVLLAGAAGAAGFILARWLSSVVAAGMNLPGADVDPDPRVYAFVVLASALCAIVAGVAPARHGIHADVRACLRSGPIAGARPGARTRSVLIGAQAAASIVLLALAALLVRSLAQVAWSDPGIDIGRLLTVTVRFPSTPDAEARQKAFWSLALERIGALPGVERAALAGFPPFGTTLGDPDRVMMNGTDANYATVVGLRVLRGRWYTASEAAAREPVAVITARLGRRYWGHDDPIGSDAGRIAARFSNLQIIGVVADAQTGRLIDGRTQFVYTPLASFDWVGAAVRAPSPREVAGALGAILADLSPGIRPNVTIVEDRIAGDFDRPRRHAILGASVALVALAVSVVGLFGLTAFVVGARTREIGIRIALGARAVDVTRLLVRQGMQAVIVGLACGLAIALIAGPFAASLLYDVSARDPVALGAAAGVLLLAALTAVLVPTRRAVRTDPAAALRDV
jgi:predicted permease